MRRNQPPGREPHGGGRTRQCGCPVRGGTRYESSPDYLWSRLSTRGTPVSAAFQKPARSISLQRNSCAPTTNIMERRLLEPAGAPLWIEVRQDGGPLPGELEHELAKQGVRPGKPCPRVIGGIVLLEGFVHEIGACGGIAQPAQALGDLGVAGAGEGAKHDRHGPDVVPADVWAADSVGGFPVKEVGVVLAQDEGAGAQVERILFV